MVSKMKQERSQPCDCRDKEKELKEKIIYLEEKRNAHMIQLNNKDKEITGYIVKNRKLTKKISELQNPTKSFEYVELSD